MITVDSSVWIHHFRGTDLAPTHILRKLLADNIHDIVLLDLVFMEVLRGFRHEADWRRARAALGALPLEIAGGEAVALRAADLYRTLRKRERTVRSPIDLLVAAWCLEHDCALLHADRDYDAIDGLHTLAVP